VVPSLERLRKEGQSGQKKINEYTRYLTVPICLVQATMFVQTLMRSESGDGSGMGLAWAGYTEGGYGFFYGLAAVLVMTTGCLFLMWLGEQIDEYGLGNGISLIILAGIVARMPGALGLLYAKADLTVAASPDAITLPKIGFLIFSFIFVVAGSILITQAQRRIPVQQAKHTRGRRVYGGSRQYLPLRVNHGGVMPIIFAQSLMLFPGMIFGWLDQSVVNGTGSANGIFGSAIRFLNEQFNYGHFFYVITEIVMIYFFAYFWTTVQFQPKEMANQLRDYGSFIPGLRPGKRTADYLEKVMMRITYVGAAFLCIIAVVPTAVHAARDIPFQITAFLGGTGLLIVVSVALDMVQRIEANLLMRNYGGFLSSPGQKGKRIKGRQY
jgi:preprotein translocase subunit SecY